MKKNRLAVWRFPYRRQICKSNTTCKGLVHPEPPRGCQNGLTTTRMTIAIIAKVGSSLTIR